MSISERHLDTHFHTCPLSVKKTGGVDTEQAASSNCAQSASLLLSTHSTLPQPPQEMSLLRMAESQSFISLHQASFSIRLIGKVL